MYLPPYKLASGVFPLRARVCVQLAAAVACWLVWSSSHEDAVTETPPSPLPSWRFSSGGRECKQDSIIRPM